MLLVVIVLAGAGTTGTAALADWEEIANQDGIAVSQLAVPGRDLPTFRGVGEIDANLYEVLAVIDDVTRHTEWMHDCSDARLLRRESDTESYVYNRLDVQWPVSDRDVVVKVEVVIVEPGREIDSRFHAVSTTLMGEVPGVVRMPRLEGHYNLTAVSPTRTKVEYQADADPGGSLPIWVAKRATRDLPLHTISKLRTQVAKTRGQYEAVVAAWRLRK